jgi:hypothetical protein
LSSSSSGNQRAHEDRATIGRTSTVARRPIDLRAAYDVALRVARQTRTAEAGHTLVWVRHGRAGAISLAATGDAFAVIGRHPACTLALLDDAKLSLRHLLVRSFVLPHGGVALRAFDLRSRSGFFLADGSHRISLVAEGPFAIAIGEHALVAFPTDTHVRAWSDRLPPAALEEVGSPYRLNARPPLGVSRLTLMPGSVLLGDAAATIFRGVEQRFAITLSRGDRTATALVSDEDLVRGVILGRATKCHSESLRRMTNTSTSRIHLLVAREGTSIFAYDLASTQGTYAHGAALAAMSVPPGFFGRKRVKRVMLPSRAGATLTLGAGRDAVRMRWQPI